MMGYYTFAEMNPNPNSLHPLSPAALDLLARRAEAAEDTKTAPRGLAPLSYPQLSRWFFAHLHPQSTAFNLPKLLTLRGHVDEPALRRALQAIVERQTALRTVYHLEGDEPTQRVVAPQPIDLSCHDLRSSATADRWRRLGNLLDAASERPFDLSSDQLIRAVLIQLADDEWRLQVTFHHIAFDGWSTGVFLADFAEEYRAAVTGGDATLPPLQSQVPEVAAWQRGQADTPAFEQARRYWRDRLRGVSPLELPLDHPAASMMQNRGGRCQVRLNPDRWASVLGCARDHDCTPFVVAFAAWAVLTARRCNQATCLLGVMLAGRTRTEWERLIGNFVNVLPIVVDLDDAPTFLALLAQVRQRSAEALVHQDFPSQLLTQDIAPVRRSGAETPFPVLFNFRNLPLALPQNLPEVSVVELTMPPRGAVAPLTLNVSPDAGGALLDLDFDADQMTALTATRWLEAYVTILGAAVAAPETPVIRLPVMGRPEQAQLAAWNETDRPRDRTLTLPALLARQAEATPDRIAVTAPDAEWTYRELAQHTQGIARVLRHHGVGPGMFVGVCMDRCAGLVAALAGVLEAGAGVVPIDPLLPRARILGMLEDAGVTILLSGPGTPALLGDTNCRLLPWDTPDEGPASSVAARPLSASDPAYVIFTSGSTGRPKGVVISQSGLVNELEWTRTEFSLEADDAVCQLSAISFDGSIWEFWLPLIAGARLVMVPPGDHRDPHAVIDVIQTHHVSVLQVVPTMLRALLDTGRLGKAESLRRVFPIGEALTWDVVTAFRRVHPAAMVNLYGPTEATIHATAWVADARTAERPVPIGRPIANMRAHVLDRHGELAPIGVQGELCLAGEGVALGYLHRPELTAERFVPDPFRPGPGRMMYHTGDLARWADDGMLEFFGRADTQIKLRGFRIELGEIEAAIGALPGVRAAAVVLQPSPDGEKRIVGYVEPAAAGPIDPAMLRTALTQQLPEYMVPAVFVIVPALPLTASGKIDRTALQPSADASSLGGEAASDTETASTTLEQALQVIWGQALGVKRVGLDDDFFELGGHSLLAAKMVNELERGTGYRVPLAALFSASTVRTFARALLEQSSPSGDTRIREVQAGSTECTPFFMLTGDMLGGGFYCRGLANALARTQPFYALPPIRPSSDIRLASIEGMAAAHLAQIRQRQPTGPYRLGGYCIGGLIAYEIARRLQEEGQDVELLVLVDSLAPPRQARLIDLFAVAFAAVAPGDWQARLDRRAAFRRRAAETLALPWRQRMAEIAGYPVRLFRRHLRHRGGEASSETPIAGADDGIGPEMHLILHHHARAQTLYRHPRYQGDVLLIRSRNPARPPAEQLASWRRIAPAAVLQEVPSDHTGVLVKELPTILREQLDRLNHVEHDG